MPAFRNIESRRSLGKVPIEYDGWPKWEKHPSMLNPSPTPYSPSPSSYSSPFPSPSPEPYSPSPSPSPPPRPKASRARARTTSDGEHIPRPRNAFIIFRSDFYALHKGKHDQNWISIHAGITWKSMEKSEKQPYLDRADEEKKEHKSKYPEYTYTPGSKAGAAKRRSMLRKKAKAEKEKEKNTAAAATVHVKTEPQSCFTIPNSSKTSPAVPRLISPVEEETPELSDGNYSRMSSEGVSTPCDELPDTVDIPKLQLPPFSEESEIGEIIKKQGLCDTPLLLPNSFNPIDAFLPAPGHILRVYDSEDCFVYPPEESFGPTEDCRSLASIFLSLPLNFEYILEKLPEAARNSGYNHSDIFAFAHVDGLRAHDPHEELVSQLEEPLPWPATEEIFNDFINFDAFD